MRSVCLSVTGFFLVVLGVCGAQQAGKVEAPANPFGLRMGMTKEQLGKIRIEPQDQPYTFMLSSVPQPHPALEFYIVEVTPKAGLCRIFASSALTTDENLFAEVERQLEDVYGKPLFLDVHALLKSAASDTIKEKLAGMAKQGVFLEAMWFKEELPLRPQLASVILTAKSSKEGRFSIIVEHQFTNYDQCQGEIAAYPKSVL